MYLPDKQIPFFAEHFHEVEDVLVKALKHSKPKISTRAAYVIENIGEKAISLESELFRVLEMESERAVRLYLYDALRGVGACEKVTIDALKQRFDFLPTDVNDLGGEEERYTNKHEHIHVAVALYVLDDLSNARPRYLHAVLKWLEPPAANLGKEDIEAYWDYRRSAVLAVEYMNGATEAIPLLKAMLLEQPQKPWVSVHVPRVLDALQSPKNT
jgi:hypothetical protein